MDTERSTTNYTSICVSDIVTYRQLIVKHFANLATVMKRNLALFTDGFFISYQTARCELCIFFRNLPFSSLHFLFENKIEGAMVSSAICNEPFNIFITVSGFEGRVMKIMTFWPLLVSRAQAKGTLFAPSSTILCWLVSSMHICQFCGAIVHLTQTNICLS